MSYIFVDTGQCGNQLGCSILDSLYQHLQHDPSHLEAFFRSSYSKTEFKRYARAVSIDTEPKVINECLQRVKDRKSWLFDSKSVVYRHGGAGNNWALGYEMCSGEFLETALNCIRRELEMCNRPPSLLITHSVAGGTGSGCGTRITEAAADEFSDVTRINLAITPYHFGEVVVQHFNTILCLAKISAASHSVITFENEIAKQLCVEMKGIERPSIHDINGIIAANIVPALLPKCPFIDNGGAADNQGKYSSPRGTFSTISDDVTELCSHPGYRFLDVKNVPQTSERSVEFTYDSWSSLVDTLQRMCLKGTFSERGTGSMGEGQRGERSVYTPTKTVSSHNDSNSSVRSHLSSPLPAANTSSAAINSPNPNSGFRSSSYSISRFDPSSSSSSIGSVSHGYRRLKSILTLRGPDSSSGLISLYETKKTASGGGREGGGGSYVPYCRNTITAPTISNIFYDDRISSIHHSDHSVNGYQRSAVLLSNSQAVLPILQRAATKGAEMYGVGAYVHQYKKCGVEEEDFITAFRTVGQIIENYRAI